MAANLLEIVCRAGRSAQKLFALLAEMPFFDNVAGWRGLRIPFFKRAQLTATDLFVAFGGLGPGRFEDLDRLTFMADNLVPLVLRLDGVLHYGEKLAAKVDRGEFLPAGSEEVVEILACAGPRLRTHDRCAAPVGAEDQRRDAGQFPLAPGQGPFHRARPRHRTRTVFY